MVIYPRVFYFIAFGHMLQDLNESYDLTVMQPMNKSTDFMYKKTINITH